MAERLSKADCFVVITPEYNHAPAPALLNFIDHFGANRFAFKPSAICAYSGWSFRQEENIFILDTLILLINASRQILKK